ncbi:MAG: hypothetical protein AAF573_05365 [Bacteroidota bacterium]
MKNIFRFGICQHLLYLLMLLISVSTVAQTKRATFDEKINGMSFLGPESPALNLAMFEGIKITNANWVALIPEATLDRQTLEIQADSLNPRWGETLEAQIQGIRLAKQAGFKVLLKPHIVLEKSKISHANFLKKLLVADKTDKTGGASWRGDFKAKNEDDWRTWEKSYEAYILNLAEVADSLNVEMLVIGTELRAFATKRLQFWQQLIPKVRNLYKGAITYSANWDEYDKILFWDELDYIGIDTYFPINFSKTPSVKKTKKNWRSIKKQLKSLSQKHQRKILMTEFGYRNISFAGTMPWIHDKGNATPNYQAQTNLYEAFFQSFWNEPWVAGGFSWNWLHAPQAVGNTDFSVENKPALKVIQKYFGTIYP